MPHDSIHARTKDTKERNGYIEGKTNGYIEEKNGNDAFDSFKPRILLLEFSILQFNLNQRI